MTMAAITLSVGSVVVTFPDGIQQLDRLAWQPVDQAIERGLTGALIVQAAAIPSGQPVTLGSRDQESGWLTLADVLQLQAWAEIPLLEMTLTLDDEPGQVIWRHHEAPAFQADAVVPFDDPTDTDHYTVTAKLMRI